ncbi:NAD-binding Rossmann fold oxidoreductase [Rhodocollybia butyracea]|uniref:NAD-binding Rossmann fold oxidoreductase n=1 Tax=Rhodocollybia butyracea TaxID=206335 RepID=A0A9P5UAY9_9AGAR|nr:NAD-binding Rossmann fold oxidoreductase [Rhodocollybia butyracea]
MSTVAKPTKPVRLGFIGLSTTGWAAMALAPPLFKAPLSSEFSLVAVSTTNTDSAQATAQKYSELVSSQADGGPKVTIKPYHGSAEHIAADRGIDMLVVSVRATHHKEVALKVIEGGKDLFIEWPIGRNLAETREIYEAALKKGIKTVVGLQTRFTGYASKVKSIVDSGEIGKTIASSFIVSMGPFASYGPTTTQKYKYIFDSSNGVTLVDVIGGHLFDLLTYILGPIASLSAILENQIPLITIIDDHGKPTDEVIPFDGPHQICVSGVLVSGAVFNVHVQTGAKETDFNWVIHGEKGTLRIRDDDRTPGRFGFVDATPKVYLNGNKIEVENVDTTTTGLAWKAFADGKAGTYATLEQGLKVKEIVFAIKKSSDGGERVYL